MSSSSARLLTAILLTAIFAAAPVSAQTHVLSGRVFGGGNALANTGVEALADGTVTVVAQTVTDGAGAYSLVLSDGTYDLRVTPPAGSGFGQETVQDVVIAGIDRTYDVVLLTEAGTLTGVVRGYGGEGVANATARVYTPNWQEIAATTTSETGQYSFALGSGSFVMQFSYGWPRSLVAPEYWSMTRHDVAFDGTTPVDIDLGVVKLSGIVRDAGGRTVSGATVQVDSTRLEHPLYRNSSGSVTTDEQGWYEILALAGSASLTVRPPDGTNGAIFTDAGIALTSDLTRDVTLPPLTYLSGVVRGYGGEGVANATARVYTPNWQEIAATTTSETGQYSFALGSGSFVMQFSYGWPRSLVAPEYWSMTRHDVAFDGTTPVDIDLGVVKLSGRVTDSNGAPVPNVVVQGDSTRLEHPLYRNSSGSVTTDEQGRYELMIISGNAAVTVRPPETTGFSIVSLANLNLVGDLTQRIILQKPDLSPPQIVAGPAVVHLSDTSVSISWATNEAATSRVEYGLDGVPGAAVDGNGFTTNHTVTLVGLQSISTYTFRVASMDAAGNGPTLSELATFTTLAPTGDVTPPIITDGPTVVFVDQTTAIVQWATDEPASSAVAFGLTDGLGSMILGPAGTFTRTHSLELTGLTPSTHYFAQVASVDPDGNGATSSVFGFTTLDVPDTTPPIITSGPTVTTHTDTKLTVVWITNEPATSGVSYNDGAEYFVVSDTTLTREHEITLSGLVPSTLYQITVSSTDAVGNGPTLGGPIEELTSPTPDTTPPIISNVRVGEVTQTTATVSWTTDEPATSTANFGTLSGSPDNTKADITAVTEHQLVLTGLLDGTQYFVTVVSTDVSGNTAYGEEVALETDPAFVDQPPTKPGPITAPPGPTAATAFTITWGESTDDVALIGYEILRDGIVVKAVGAHVLSYDESDLLEGSFTYQIRARDNVDQTALSEPVTVVIDRTPPLVEVPADIDVDAVGTGAPVVYVASAIDSLDGPVGVVCVPESGSSFPVGRHSVECTARDTAGNVGTASFVVTVRDVTPPTLIVPANQRVEASGPGGSVVMFVASAQDLVDPAPTVNCTPGSGTQFPLGTTTVACTAEDVAGNTATGSFTIEVVDGTPPTITRIVPSPGLLWPPLHQMVAVSVAVSATDAVTTRPACRITSVSSSEAVEGLGDGDTAPDWLLPGGLTVNLRAERSGKGNGRTYTLTVACEDGSGNSTVQTTTVGVPKSQGKR